MAGLQARIALALMALMIAAGFQARAFGQMSEGHPSGTAAASAPAYPKDVYADSGFRLPLPKREDMDPDGKKFFDAVVGPNNRNAGRLRSAWGIWMYNPKVGALERELSQYLRSEAGLGGHVRLLAILVTARELNSQLLWTGHVPIALKEGVPQELLDIVKNREGVDGLPETDAVIIQLGRQMFGPGKVDAETFARARKLYGTEKLVNLVSFMGYFSAQAALLKTFDNQLDPEQKPLLPVQ